MVKQESNTPIKIAGLLILGILFIAGITFPISANRDLYVKVTVQKPLIGDAKITDIEASATGHTLLESPAMADILTSGKLKIAVESGNVHTSKTVDSVWRGGEDTFSIVLRDIPKNQATATVKLYEDGTLTDTQSIQIFEEGSR